MSDERQSGRTVVDDSNLVDTAGVARVLPRVFAFGVITVEEMEIQFVVEESLVSDVRPAVTAEGGTILSEEPVEPETEDRLTGLEPLIILSVAMAAGALIRIISDTMLDHKHPGGFLIDARTTPMTIERDDSLDRGTLIVVTESETQTFFPEEREDALKLLQRTLGTDVRLP